MDELDEIDEYNSDSEYDIIQDLKDDVNIEDSEEFKNLYNTKKNITSPKLSIYEKTRVLTERTHQIDNGCIPYISNIERFTDSYSIALEEFKQKKIPFIIRRPLPNMESYEYWKLSDML
jgi:DNA-directed RNA polymerases I, II, and III subunit RPABC2